MIPYRIYRLDHMDRIAGVVEQNFASDQEALEVAEQMSDPSAPVEVWQFGRCLGQVRGSTLADRDSPGVE